LGSRDRIRPIAARDLDLLVAHRRKMWMEVHYAKKRRLDEADAVYRRWIQRQRKTRRLHGVVAVDAAGRPLASGCVWLYEVHPRPGRPGPYEPYIMSMYTEPEARGRGLATRIVRELLRWCRARGFGGAFLHASDAGRPIYAKLGFTPTREMRLRWAR
jgi:GNAT superfamily N-acetyltransferase